MSKDNFKAFGYEEVKNIKKNTKKKQKRDMEIAMLIKKAKKKHQNILKMIGKISWEKLVLYMKN